MTQQGFCLATGKKEMEVAFTETRLGKEQLVVLVSKDDWVWCWELFSLRCLSDQALSKIGSTRPKPARGRSKFWPVKQGWNSFLSVVDQKPIFKKCSNFSWVWWLRLEYIFRRRNWSTPCQILQVGKVRETGNGHWRSYMEALVTLTSAVSVECWQGKLV